MSYTAVSSHRSMALDARRNEAYHAALAAVVGPETVVLDLGAGTGVHGLMAARLGAKRVYLVEPEDIIDVAGEIARANGLETTVRCIQGRIEEVQLPEQADVIVSVLTGNFLLTEDLLPTLVHARHKWLKPGGRMIPSAAAMEAVPVMAPDVHQAEVASWSAPQLGLDLSVARTYAANTIFYRGKELRGLTALAAPKTLHTIDLTRDEYTSVRIDAAFEVEQGGTCHGIIGWLNLKLGDTRLSTSPYEPALHWSTAFLPLDPPLAVERGEELTFALDRAPFGDWTWSVNARSGQQHHSTLFSSPMTARSLDKARVTHTPALNAEGRLLRDTLSLCEDGRSVEAVARHLRQQYADRFASEAEAVTFVQRIVRRYA